MPEERSRPIIIRRRARGHEARHGGAWKVAYADFVTAMMALFIVLWLMNSSAKVREAVSGYFKDPAGIGKLAGTDKGRGNSIHVVKVPKDDMEQLKQQLEKAMKTLPRFQELQGQIALSVTREGLRIELMETEAGLFFESGSPKPSQTGVELLRRLAEQLGRLPNRILIEGHTDARPFVGRGAYSNWELSSDRANQARIIMQSRGLRPDQVYQVRGYADQQLRDRGNPNNPSNRRITLIVKYAEDSESPAGAAAARPAAEPDHGP